MQTRAIVLGFVLVAAGAQTGEAQRRAVHEGFWIAPALGAAATFSDPLYDGDGGPEAGASLSLALGGTLSQRVLLGAEVAGWMAGGSIYRGHTALTVLYYLSPRGGLYVNLLAGLAHREVDYTFFTPDGPVTLAERNSGLALGAAVGYDIQLARNFFLTPSTQAAVQYLADHWAPTISLRLAATWH